MYFPVGWPKVLHSNGVTKGKPLRVFRHRTKNYVIELRGHSVAFWHSRLKLLVSSYVRSRECLEKHGDNVTAALKPDGTALVIAASKGHLLFLRLQYEGFSTTNSQSNYSTQEHGILLHHNPHLNVSGDGNELELISIKYSTETAVVGGILSVVTVGGSLLISTAYGVLHRVSWEGKFDSSMTINLNLVPFSNDLLPESRGQPLGESSKSYARDIVYSLELHGFSVVLNDGRGGFLTNKSPRYEPQSMQVVWIKDLCGAVCTAANAKYQLLAFGKENGTVDVFGVDETSGVWNLSHTLQFTKRQFPETGVQLGAVQCLEWSHSDGMVIAVSWKNGGLSLWSVFGSLLLCSLGDQPGTPSPLNPHCTVLESLCWSSDSYHLWMLPTDTTKKPLSGVADKDDVSHGSSEGGGGRTRESTSHDEERGNSNGDHVLVMQFMRNAIVDNPVIANHQHLFLQGSERLYLNTSRSVTTISHSYRDESSSAMDRMVSAPQWKVIQLPLSYLVLNWPIKYAALNTSGTNLAVAGRAGFALYSGSRRKWKLFGNEVQEQSLVCRGGLAWYNDVIVFPCRVYEKSEEIRFYYLHSNLDNSQLLENLKSSSPILCLNIHGDYLVLASRDHHMTILGLSTTVSSTKGLVLTVTKLHEVYGKTFPQPWATKLISVIPSNIRTEPAFSQQHQHTRGGGVVAPLKQKKQATQCCIDSVLFNFSGKLIMIQQDNPNSLNMTVQEDTGEEERFYFAPPVCLAGSVEAIWTPPYHYRCSELADQHLMDSLWLSCGASGIKVWLPLHPQDESHPTFLSKRIMLTLQMTVYPQAVVFMDAILYGLSHETSYTETRLTTRHSFPFATIERTTHVFLHHILRQLLRRNLGSHAFQIARSCSHLPYFSHVLELMLHEILEEEAPGSMPVPDALLPRVVEFIKQFPEFLETVGHCARKTEVALWQYLFAAVGNPRDLFDLCISDGRLKTAATYLIIIQNLETAAVSRQLATRLLDAALDSNSWELCKDLVRFLRAIGPGDVLDSPLITTTTPLKTPTPTPSPMTSLSFNERMTPTVAVPDLDRSAMNVTRDHLSSGSVSSVVSLSGDYRDASGKVIRRPQFVMDVDSKEEYFIELILCRHARKLLTARCLRDLGKFSAHLDFNLQMWLARERLRAAKVDDFVSTIRELHKEFKWPFPLYNAKEQSNLFSPSSTLQSLTPQELDTPTSETTPLHITPTNKLLPDQPSKKDSPQDDETSSLTSSLKRINRPPDLDLTPAQNQLHNVILEPTQKPGEASNASDNSRLLPIAQGEFDPTRSSTPTRHSGSISERISLVLKQNPSSVDLNAESSSLGEIAEESDLEVYSDINMATEKGGSLLKGSAQAEKEIRYFVEVMLESQCMEWTMLLSILLLDSSLVAKVVDTIRKQISTFDFAVFSRLMHGYDELYTWAETECPGYIHFLNSIQSYFKHLNSLSEEKASPVASVSTPVSMSIHEERIDTQVSLKDDEVDGHGLPSSPQTNADAENSSACILS